ncbi:phosphoribosylanthranilate isomerase [Hymenobacter busanensis]|uniref:N-(5'-phosphoribosyl)anthranilate isomerase n=1 Tax=Hymenobacter busanensis TaxID=2607656 RepID=A0A7L4ZUI8_9BACT|nr:phosphoribosylanthranilate isomerase [Hymenobacter busanensis]KAA9339388.1 phosphoribosylanthranilate isomerase [Hymenobacter busanensis]QHJ06851.1 phosphoribosylanthranilate isomerase [Hymenobacter busanensis]
MPTIAASAQRNLLPVPNAGRRLVKVCGLKYPDNVAAVAALGPDMLGFIFTPKSPRYAADTLDAAQLRGLRVAKVGVFVNEKPAVIRRLALHFGLDAVQLHGQESAAECATLAAAGLPVLKAFGVGETFDVRRLDDYAPHCSFFVFDTAGPAAGGNGFAFDWSLLQAYDLPTPYLLAGGLGPEHAAELRQLQLPGLAGFDFNSRLELAPGLKDDALVQRVLRELRN